MSVSTNGQICYGVMFSESWEFPWREDAYSYDIDCWWRDICGYKPPFEMFDENDAWIEPRPSEEKIEEYWGAMREFDAAHPVPVKVVNYCSGDYPMYIIAVPNSYRYNYRGYAEAFNPSDLSVTDEERDSLIDFLGKYCMDGGSEYRKSPDIEPKWFLSSYWG